MEHAPNTASAAGGPEEAHQATRPPKWWKPGPALMVTACFVGPGTVTTASLAGADFGMTLMWAVLFSILATIVLQEMAARLGLASGLSLGQALRRTITQPILRLVVIVLVVSALGIGSAVYAQGDMLGTALGLSEATGTPAQIWPLITFAAVSALLLTGRFTLIMRVLGVLVAIMAIVFVATAIMVRPDPLAMLKGTFVPTVPDGSAFVIIGLIGTTVVGYNLFLHSSGVIEYYPRGEHLKESIKSARADTALSITLGGLITLAILATAAAAFFTTGIPVESAATMATQLEPLLGPSARYFFAAGLFSAGLTSVIAGGLAAAFAVSTTLGWGQDLKSWRFRAIWLAVLGYGAIVATLGDNPIAAILFAQATNGVLLPILAITLLLVMNNRTLLGRHANSKLQNAVGALIVLVVIGLSLNSLLGLIGVTG
ncbi:Nramp family divalent metal transporter [Brevibacterium sp.]|uniref:Nramp family divalent metal transporter n=1 Tax=Brevibacterium sp. TaxID=1701 RepID=UPI002811706D|nr:Nramp family divalent metal transporter [Brevibacterium sp.]